MTKEEILKMEAGPEIDVLFAEVVMGWERSGNGWYKPQGGDPFLSTGYQIHVFRPSTNISHAMEGVEKLEYNWTLNREVGMCGSTATAGTMQYRFILAGPGLSMAGIEAETAPLAITRALILWAMEKEATDESKPKGD